MSRRRSSRRSMSGRREIIDDDEEMQDDSLTLEQEDAFDGADEDDHDEDEDGDDGEGEEEEEEEEDEDDEDDSRLTPQPRRRGRPPGSKNKTTLAREQMTGVVRPPVKRRPIGYDGEIIPGRRGRKPKRGRPNGTANAAQINPIPLDDNGVPYEVANDELLLDTDEAGEKKIDANGNLLGGRDYRVRTFTVLGREDRLYMLSTEPARCMGFRDSYLLFQKHRKLYKIIASEEEKYDLIQRDLIPHSYKGRAIAIVTARSIFREFGARIVVGGKRIVDDYYEEEARNAGFISGQLADPDDAVPAEGEEYNKNQYVAWHGASAVYHNAAAMPTTTREMYQESAVTHRRKKVPVTDENWMVEHAVAASMYNSTLLQQRLKTWTAGGVYEPHTGISFYPQSTQPLHAVWCKVTDANAKPSKKVTIDTIVSLPNPFTRTGLKDVPPEIFEHVSPEIKASILAQQQNERAWELRE